MPGPVPDEDEPGEEIEALNAIELPPMLPGLPNTPYDRCAALICAIVWQAIIERDFHWCASQKFNFYLSLIGWDNAMILGAKRAALQTSKVSSLRGSMGNFLTYEPGYVDTTRYI
jgi:hypothetical protein